MERLLVNTPATISATWYSAGVVANPGTVTVVVVRADGTTVATGSATGSGAIPRSFNLTTTHTASLDSLKATWTSATLGLLVTRHEVVGDFLFTLSDGLSQFTEMTAAEVAAARVKSEQELEDACGVAFVPRYDRELLSGDRSTRLVLRRMFIRKVRAVTVDGTALSSLELAKVIPDGNAISYENGFMRGIRNVAIDYEHGFDFPPGGADRAALRLARRYLVADSFDDRVIAASAGEESFTFSNRYNFGNFSPPHFGIPEVDSFVAANDYRRTVG